MKIDDRIHHICALSVYHSAKPIAKLQLSYNSSLIIDRKVFK